MNNNDERIYPNWGFKELIKRLIVPDLDVHYSFTQAFFFMPIVVGFIVTTFIAINMGGGYYGAGLLAVPLFFFYIVVCLFFNGIILYSISIYIMKRYLGYCYFNFLLINMLISLSFMFFLFFLSMLQGQIFDIKVEVLCVFIVVNILMSAVFWIFKKEKANAK